MTFSALFHTLIVDPFWLLMLAGAVYTIINEVAPEKEDHHGL